MIIFVCFLFGFITKIIKHFCIPDYNFSSSTSSSPSGFVQFSGPYYMVLITEKAQIGSIINHKIYTITKTEMIPLSNSTYGSNLSNSKNENRLFLIFNVNVQ